MTQTEEPSGEALPVTSTKRTTFNGLAQVAFVVGVLAAGLIANRVLSSGASAPQIRVSGAAITTVDVVQPEIGDVQVRLNETGTVQVRNSIDLSPQVTGRVVMVNPALASGGTFRRGEVLFRLDDADYRANIDRARADLAARQAELQVEQAEADIAQREWDLVNPGEPIPSNVAREPQLASAKAGVQSAQAALEDARLDLNRVTFSLPFDGRVLSTTIEVGQNLSAGQSYGRAYDPSGVEVSVAVSTFVIEAFAPVTGRDAVVRSRNVPIASANTAYAATVIRADAELDQETRLARLIIGFAETVSLLPGDFVDVELTGPTVPNAYMFPERAIQENRSVWVVEEGQLVLRQPQLVSVEDGNVMALPFDTGDGIVVSALNNPQEGDSVVLSGAELGAGEQP
ncbi:MAG: efflux RND transporter periplasmic adaptor subunit [Pseudomonadota bacterium]